MIIMLTLLGMCCSKKIANYRKPRTESEKKNLLFTLTRINRVINSNDQ